MIRVSNPELQALTLALVRVQAYMYINEGADISMWDVGLLETKVPIY